jgi:hypothetical protein
MKIEIKQKEAPYPKLMISENGYYIVLFYEKEKGTILNPRGSGFDGYPYGEIWLYKYKDFEGSITLSNY